MKDIFRNTAVCIAVLLILVCVADGQRKAAVKPAAKPRPVIFAVLNAGKYIEPIALVDKGGLTGFYEGSVAANSFNKEFYSNGTEYSLIFGGTVSGKVTVTGSNPKAECSAQIADVSISAPKVTLGNGDLALATNETGSAKAKRFRRPLTEAETWTVDSLVKDEFKKNKVKAEKIEYRSLLAIDRDHDGKPEFVGTVLAAPTAKTRVQLFFIAEPDESGLYRFGYSDLGTVDEKDTMGGDLAPIDGGVGSEVFLESLEFDGDDANEIFTYTLTYEGANFKVYGKYEGKWEVAYQKYNYHCAY